MKTRSDLGSLRGTRRGAAVATTFRSLRSTCSLTSSPPSTSNL